MAFAPANVPPVPVQEVALVALQVSVEAAALTTAVGFAVSVAVGSGTILTVAEAAALVPPMPLHVNEYVVAAVRFPVL